MGQLGGCLAIAANIVVHQTGVPVLECGMQRAIQGPGPRLQNQMSPTSAPLHLLLLSKTFAVHRIHRRLDKGGGDPLARPIPLAIVDQAILIAGDVDLELPHGDPELAQIGIATVEGFEVKKRIIDGLPSTIGVAVPEEPLDPAQLINRLRPGLLVMVHQSLGELAENCDPHGDVEPVEDVLAAWADPLGKGADLVPAVSNEGQILIRLEALVSLGTLA